MIFFERFRVEIVIKFFNSHDQKFRTFAARGSIVYRERGREFHERFSCMEFLRIAKGPLTTERIGGIFSCH